MALKFLTVRGGACACVFTKRFRPSQAWLRVLLGYHTYPQLAAGLVLGSGVACCWFAVFLAAVEPAIAAQPVNEVRLMVTTLLASALFAVAFFRRWAAGQKGNRHNA